MTAFVLDASYSLTWCFADRSTPNTDAVLHRMEARLDRAIVPAIWQFEVANALGKAVIKAKLSLDRALDVWSELHALPIQQMAYSDLPAFMELAITNDLSVYDTCYLKLAKDMDLPLATNDRKLQTAAENNQVTVWIP
jgi:predicted nucleic acid-binding protein